MSIVSICNEALGRVGDLFIASLDDSSRQAKLCNMFYDNTRRQLLSLHPWVFAEELKADLSPTTTTPAFKYDYKFTLPSDLIVVRGLYEAESDYIISGKSILSNDSTINLVYTKDVDDPNDFSTMFRSTLVLRLAYSVAFALAPSSELAKLLFSVYGTEFAEARRVDNAGRDWSLKLPLPSKGEKPAWTRVREL